VHDRRSVGKREEEGQRGTGACEDSSALPGIADFLYQRRDRLPERPRADTHPHGPHQVCRDVEHTNIADGIEQVEGDLSEEEHTGQPDQVPCLAMGIGQAAQEEPAEPYHAKDQAARSKLGDETRHQATYIQ